MQQENDDMDELLRKAAENYPLRTDTADWEKVRTGLEAESFSNASAKNNNRRSLWLLLLLLPLGFGGYYYFSTKAPSHKIVVKNISDKINKISQPGVNNNNTEIAETSAQPNVHQTPVSNFHTVQYIPERNNIPERNKNVEKIILPAKTEDNQLLYDKNSGKIVIAEKTKGEEENKTIIEATDKMPADQVDVEKGTLQTVKKSDKNKKQKNNFLYAGVIVSPEISTVKFQSIKNMGINMGVILGYQLNKKLSIETGLAWNKKFYYSRGEYFNTGKIYLPPNAKITNVNGNCKMIEVPVNVKYNFKSSGKTTWSSTVGLSSYFMKEENYNYTIISTGAPYPYDKTYKESSQYLLSVMNVSAGYNHSLGKVGTLRIEPYVKIPLKGMGVGSLPITSAGVNIGLTKKIF